MKQSEYSNPFQNLKKILLLYKRNSKYTYQSLVDSFYVKKEIVSISQKGDYMDEYLNVFWLYLKECFYREPQEQDLLILSHFIGTQKSSSHFENQDQEEQKRFQSQMENIFTETYLKEPITNKVAILNRRNWFEYNFFVWKSNLESKTQKYQLIEVNKRIKQSRTNLEPAHFKLKREQKILETLVASQQEKMLQLSNESEIQNQIERLQIQRSKVVASNKLILQKIKQKINGQLTQLPKQTQINKEMIHKRDTKIAEVVHNIQQEFKYIKQQINILEKKQIAESFSKLIKVQKIKNEFFYTISFQEALNLKCSNYDQKVYKHLNTLRDNSLQSCYFVGWKSKFNYVSQKFQHFANILRKRTYDFAQIDNQIVNNSVTTQFQQMQICHQCKCFYKKQKMQKCAYNSVQYDQPRPKHAAFDHYIAQVLKNLPKNEKERLESQISPSYYFRYKFEKNVYTCNRYYCKLCLKAYNFDRKIQLCPFCVGTCYCTRCVRNQTIFKLKTFYLRICGNLQELQELMNDLNQKTDKILVEPEEKQSNKQTVTYSCSESNNYKSMRTCQKQILRLQNLIYLTAKRQKLKRKLVQSRKCIFRQQYKKSININLYNADIKRLLK